MKTSEIDYLNFDVLIESSETGAYPVRIQSPGGEPGGTFVFPNIKSRLQSVQSEMTRQRTRALTPGNKNTGIDSRSFGESLFSALFHDNILTAYRLSREKARHVDKGLRLRLKTDVPELAALPWELLYDNVEGDYVALSSRTPVLRYLELDRPPPPVPVAKPLRILGMIALPDDVAHLDAADERRRIEQELVRLVESGQVIINWVEGQTWRDLQRTIRNEPWNVFHFIGHGSGEIEGGSVIFADESGSSTPLPATEFARLLAAQPALGLVLLNSCEGAQEIDDKTLGSSAATLVRRGLPAVIAMQQEVSDRGAITLARDFYAALADGLPVEAALAEARTAASLEAPDTHEWATPVLHMRAKDGCLFDLQGEAAGEYRKPASDGPQAADDDEFPEIPGGNSKIWIIGIVLAIAAYLVVLFFM